MPELDHFEMRLAAAVQAFADRAQTRVDPMAVADGAIGRRRRPRFAWLGLPLPVPSWIVLLLGLLLLALLGTTLLAGAREDERRAVAPSASPAPTERPAPSPTRLKATDGEGDEIVVGTEVQTQVRGGVVAITSTMDDPRASGTGTFLATVDGYGQVASEWGTFRLENAAGVWEGTCTGAASEDGSHTATACWLLGSGGYAGYTYYRIHRAITGRTAPFDVEGVIFPGAPPDSTASEVP